MQGWPPPASTTTECARTSARQYCTSPALEATSKKQHRQLLYTPTGSHPPRMVGPLRNRWHVKVFRLTRNCALLGRSSRAAQAHKPQALRDCVQQPRGSTRRQELHPACRDYAPRTQGQNREQRSLCTLPDGTLG